MIARIPRGPFLAARFSSRGDGIGVAEGVGADEEEPGRAGRRVSRMPRPVSASGGRGPVETVIEPPEWSGRSARSAATIPTAVTMSSWAPGGFCSFTVPGPVSTSRAARNSARTSVSSGNSEPVVKISEPLGRSWKVTMAGDRITSLTVYGRDIDQKTLSAVPLANIKSVAHAHLAIFEAEAEHVGPSIATEVASVPPGKARSASPTTDEFAEAYRSTPERVTDDETGEMLTRRQALNMRWPDVSLYTIDKWIQGARKRGLIEPARGRKRGRKPQQDKENEQ